MTTPVRGTPSATSPARAACHLTAKGLELTRPMRARILREARKLERFYPRILETRVVVSSPHRRLHREPVQYAVTIRLAVPLSDLVVRRRQGPDLLQVVQESFKAAGRKLQDHARRYRVPVPAQARPAKGRVVRLFPGEGYGFLLAADGTELYFHRNSVLDGRFGDLEVGSEVRYAATAGDEGPQASTVVPAARRRRPPRSTVRKTPPAAG